MNRILRSLLAITIAVSSLVPTVAAESRTVTLSEFLLEYFDTILPTAPRASEYIALKYTNIDEDTPLYQALQRAVYYDLINNKAIALELDRPVMASEFRATLARHTGQSFTLGSDKPLDEATFQKALAWLEANNVQAATGGAATITSVPVVIDSYSPAVESAENFDILANVYDQLRTSYVDESKVSEHDLVEGAIKGMVESIEDPHSTYFPPKESQDFITTLDGNLEGIGAYVEMEEAGKLVIISPIVDSPAEKAGILAGDIVRAVDGAPITEDMQTSDATALIKGPSGTKVTLTIERDGETFDVEITRAAIHIPFVTHNQLDTGEHYVRISMFGTTVASEFNAALEKVFADSSDTSSRIIFDLRNNPGGSLEEVQAMLNTFVPAGEPMTEVRSRYGIQRSISDGTGYNRFKDRDVVILINGGSASASEIFTLVARDYLPHVKIIGEQSYGK
ncbi:MAG TPA: S41 family peptidase [bacterium]|nr:S41 family peptidase [bacterium]